MIESIEDHRRARSRAVSPLATVEEAIEEFRQGRSVVIVDDEDRENEDDLCIPGQFVTQEPRWDRPVSGWRAPYRRRRCRW